MQKTPLMQLKEIQHGGTLEDLIRGWVEEELSWTEIAAKLGIPYSTMNDWRRQLGIRTVRTVHFDEQPVG